MTLTTKTIVVVRNQAEADERLPKYLPCDLRIDPMEGPDRKSTRLNSSH